jgi:putative endonuclease
MRCSTKWCTADPGSLRALRYIAPSSRRSGSAAHRCVLRCARETPVLLMRKRYFVYILTNRPKGVLYVGVTNNLARRTLEHKTKLVPGFTSKYGLTVLVHYEEYQSILEARDRERALKHWRRAWKFKLIETMNPTWRDLYDELILL